MDNENFIVFAAKNELKNFGDFLIKYDGNLQKLLSFSDYEECSQKTFSLIDIKYSSDSEEVSTQKLVDSDRKLHKTIVTFTQLINELQLLVIKSKQHSWKIIFLNEEIKIVVQEATEALCPEHKISTHILQNISGFVDYLLEVSKFIQWSIVLLSSCLRQCAAVLSSNIFNLELQLGDVFESMVDLMVSLASYDAIFASSEIRSFWPLYLQVLEALLRKAKGTGEDVSILQQQLNTIMSCNVFQYFFNSICSLKEILGTEIGKLSRHFNTYLKQFIRVRSANDLPYGDNTDEFYNIVRLNVFVAFIHNFSGLVDQKVFKQLLELNTKFQDIVIIANIRWSPMAFLYKHCASLTKNLGGQNTDWNKCLELYYQSIPSTLSRSCKQLWIEITEWVLDMYRIVEYTSYTISQFDDMLGILAFGIRNAKKISYLIKDTVNKHISKRRPIVKQVLASIFKLLEMLKIIQHAFEKYRGRIGVVLRRVVPFLQYEVINVITQTKKKISSKHRDNNRIDIIASLKIVEKCLIGPPTITRIRIASFVLTAINENGRVFSTNRCAQLNYFVQHMKNLCEFQHHLEDVCSTHFIYWHQSLISAYLKQGIDVKIHAHYTKTFSDYSTDCLKKLVFLGKGGIAKAISNHLKRSNSEHIRNAIESKLSAQVETFLRIEVHANLNTVKEDLLEKYINDYRDLINAEALNLNGNYFSAKDYIENYLSAMFYNLTTISLCDWKTYEEMRNLAFRSFKLQPIEDYLPNQTSNQNLDILEIMRKIDIFVSMYCYNVHLQTFVERESSSKHLDTISIRQVSNSLQTHGTGVINTTVNYSYQFLRHKFYMFSQFLYDEQINSRLLKDFREYSERKKKDQHYSYSFEKAEAFNREIKRLGVLAYDRSYMDLFRKLITLIGNTLGYVRLIHSGSVHTSYGACHCLPKFSNQDLKFSYLSQSAKLHGSTLEAAEIFETVVQSLIKPFSESTNFFKLLLEAFQPFFQNPRNIHLKNFFLIVPPLTLNYVEHMIKSKVSQSKNKKQTPLLFDDGFIMGLVYILKLLNQIEEFNSLQWFSIVRQRFEAERRKIHLMTANSNEGTENASKASGPDDLQSKKEMQKLQQTIALTESRIRAYQKEFNLLYYNMGSVKIFFQ